MQRSQEEARLSRCPGSQRLLGGKSSPGTEFQPGLRRSSSTARAGRTFKWTPPLTGIATGGEPQEELAADPPSPPRQPFQPRCSATQIQAAFRDWLACRGPRAELSRALDAAKCLQRWWRMLQSRRHFQLMLARLWWRLACELMQLDKAARALQGGFHMGQLRCFRRSAVDAARKIQAYWRGAAVRLALRFLRLAVRRLQRWHRWRRERDRLLAHMRQLCGEARRAAVLLQSRWRGHATRRRVGQELQRRRLVARSRRKSGPQKGSGQASPSLQSKRPALYSSRSSLRSAAKLRSQSGLLERSNSGVVQGSGRQDWKASYQAARADSGKLFTPLLRALSSSLDASSAIPAPTTQSVRSSAGGGPLHVDSQMLLVKLLSRGVLSSSPRPPPWPQEHPGSSDLEAVQTMLKHAVPSVEVRAVFRVETSTASSVAYHGVQRTLGPERLLWHGTPWEAVGNIVQNGFNRAYVGRHGTKLGRGTYFAEDASYAMRFCGRGPSRAIFLAGVLPGRYCRGEEGLVEPPLADSSGARYDSTVDDVEQPRIFCVFRDFQALPMYLAAVA